MAYPSDVSETLNKFRVPRSVFRVSGASDLTGQVKGD